MVFRVKGEMTWRRIQVNIVFRCRCLIVVMAFSPFFKRLLKQLAIAGEIWWKLSFNLRHRELGGRI
jgi:hypothetical protein